MLPLQESPLIFTTTLQGNPHPPPCLLPPFYTWRNQDSMRLNIPPNPWLARDRGGAVREVYLNSKPKLFSLHSTILFSGGKWLIKDKLHILGHSLVNYFSINQRKQHVFLNTLLRTMPDTVKTIRNVLSPWRTS